MANPNEPKKQKRKKKKKGENVRIYGRVRPLMPWEPRSVSLEVKPKQIRNQTDRGNNEYTFNKCFNVDIMNDDIFKVIVEPMIDNVLNGFNAILIAYGQTGSGKTYSMLGKPDLDVVGLLPMMLKRFVDTPSVHKVELSAVEAFGHHVARIELYDLYEEYNQNPNWTLKKGNTTFEPTRALTVQIKTLEDAYQKIEYAHAASHFAPTGKNPESSRGHVCFCAKVYQDHPTVAHAEQISYFVMVDCAGSEGESAFTKDFIEQVDKTTLMARRLEAGCINTGLCQLQVIFNELRYKGELSKMIGNGLRRILHPYINTQTYLSVLFTFSPSINNAKSTESTLKFAVTAGMVKVKPIQAEAVVNLEKLVEQLRKHIEENDKLIDTQNDKITDLTAELETTKQHAISDGNLPADFTIESDDDEDDDDNAISSSGGSGKKKRKKKRADAHQSVLNAHILEQLNELDAESDDDDYVLDDMFVTNDEDAMAAEKVEKEMEEALARMTAVANGAEIVKSAVGNVSGNDDEKAREAMLELNATLKAATADVTDSNAFDDIDMPVDLDELDTDGLKDHCETTWVQIEEDREEASNLKKSQQTVVSHLVETNEWLFNALSEILNAPDDQ